uniref:Uncharacterized protein n=1 Tax=Sus scrofa TaxID=9823 RepID=A0A8D1GU08_PIG
MKDFKLFQDTNEHYCMFGHVCMYALVCVCVCVCTLSRKHSCQKMLNSANYYRNANKNYNEVLPYTSQNVHDEKVYNTKCWGSCGEKGTLLHCWWECQLMQPLGRTVWRLLKKLKMELPCDSAVPFLGVYLDKTLI